MYVTRQADAVGVTDDVSIAIGLRSAKGFQHAAVVDAGGKAVVGAQRPLHVTAASGKIAGPATRAALPGNA